MLLIRDYGADRLSALLFGFGLILDVYPDTHDIPASFWGAPEAGLRGDRVNARGDTPIHSVLHEAAHAICMSPARRACLDTDAGGSDAEECAVCYLQVLLGATLPGVGASRLMTDMDAWGYSFRLGSTAAWFETDAAEARAWLVRRGIIDARGAILGTQSSLSG